MEAYLVLLRVEFTMPLTVTRSAVRSYRTLSPLPRERGGLLSAALVVGLRPPGVTWHPTLWSPDFPPSACADSDCLADSSSSLISAHYECKRYVFNTSKAHW